METNFKRNLSIGFGLSLLILLASSFASFFSIQNLLISNQLVNRKHKIITELENVISTLKDAETGQRGFLLTGQPEYLQPYEGAYDRAMSSFVIINELTIEDSRQQQSCARLKELIDKRMLNFQTLISLKKANKPVTLDELWQGKQIMDEVRRVVQEMKRRTESDLVTRTARLGKFAAFTPVLVIVAALMAVIITGIFYMRVKKDYAERTRVQKELETKEANLSKRIQVMQEVSKKVSAGNYRIRVSNEKKDPLGGLADSLNEMAESLQYSFEMISDKEWLQTGMAALNEKVIDETDITRLTRTIISFVADYTKSQVGALYLKENQDTLRLASGFSFVEDGTANEIRTGQGFVGQCALSGRQMIVKDIDATHMVIHFAGGNLKPKNIIAVPMFYEREVTGVMELASTEEYLPKHLAFFDAVSEHIGIVVNSHQNRLKLQALLEKAHLQTEELNTQHRELRELNVELESHSQKLQASEEELRVQQEELLESNQVLEERTSLLEERNQLIQERNVEIQTKAEQLEISTKYKSEFLANMSHELRTPLNSILLLSGLMVSNNENKLPDEYVEYAKVIQNSGKGLHTLIDEILDLSRLESGKMELDHQTTFIDDVVSNMNELFTPVANQGHIVFTISVDPEVPKTMFTDKMRLEQIIKNLLSNALKFTPRKGSVSLNIFVPSHDKNSIGFAVKDTGIGIARNKQELIFEVFQQADGSTSRKYGGTGLGLSISRELVKLLNGKIQLTSEPEKGSEFVIYIPVTGQVADAKTGIPVGTAISIVPDPKSDPGSATESYAVNNDWQVIADDRTGLSPDDKVLLIVEDDVYFARLLLDFTRKNGYKGIVSTRGDEGLSLAKQFKPAGVLLDIKLPAKDGWEVMEELKKDPFTRHIPVHIMSATEYTKESLEKGAADFINKDKVFEKIINVFKKMDDPLSREDKKVLIVEENEKHAKALAYFLQSAGISTEIQHGINEGIASLLNEDVDCVIMDMAEQHSYKSLEEVRKTEGLENLPIIILTAKNLSAKEEIYVRESAGSIVVKTAVSFQRTLDEISLFLHVVDKGKPVSKQTGRMQNLAVLNEVLQNKTVLIADDDIRNIFSITKSLEAFNMKVIPAMDGKEALHLLHGNRHVDIILMDMMMPEMDGFETIIQIRKELRIKNIPVIAVTAKAMAGDREKCIEAGASDYITKPVDLDQLLSLLRVWLYEKQLNHN